MLPQWVALAVSFGSALASGYAVSLHRRKLRYDTTPILNVCRGQRGATQIENTGPAAATGISLCLIERSKRPSGRLAGTDILRTKESLTIYAYDYPKELEDEMRKERLLSVEDVILRLHGQKPRIASELIAEYLLSREGNQLLVVHYRVAGESKIRRRVYRHTKNSQGFTEFVPCGKIMSNRFIVHLLQRWNSRNSQFAPPFDWGALANREPLKLGKDLGKISEERTAS